ncbi:MAG: hypothetical protein CMM44_07530 [Rhodospirillaceae bacterium]|nr:hypothetical protein [Rhodospirillaceae bacterium]|tara:strand:+ start:971 stop:1966 length:996 start_codon:yes stop_codon:yes gene_type:complete
MFSEPILSCLKAPGSPDDSELIQEIDALVDLGSQTRYNNIGTVPNLYEKPAGDGSKIDSSVHSFYEENPFPSYEGLQEFGDLVTRGHNNPFMQKILESIGFNKKVLECGCGTGQMSHFLQLNNNHVLGIDASAKSLSLAIEHKLYNNLERSNFCRMNIFDLALKDEVFDVVISHGVLHHTHNAKLAFEQILKKVKPGGLIIIGLYNKYARVMTWLRSKMHRFWGDNIDWVVRTRIRDKEKARIWIADQYYNPHETWHTIDEVMKWFEENNVEYLNCSPPILDTNAEQGRNFSDKTSPGTHWQRVITQLGWIGSISREGALFDIIGRKRLLK